MSYDRLAVDIMVYVTHAGGSESDYVSMKCQVWYDGPTTKWAAKGDAWSQADWEQVARDTMPQRRITGDTYKVLANVDLRKWPPKDKDRLITFGSNVEEPSPYGGAARVYGDWVDMGSNGQCLKGFTATVFRDETICASVSVGPNDPMNWDQVGEWHKLEREGTANTNCEIGVVWKFREVPAIPEGRF